MGILDVNAGRVKHLTGAEIWLFIVARVLIGFGIGVVGERYFPTIIEPLGIPAVIVGLVLFFVAAKGLRRANPISN